MLNKVKYNSLNSNIQKKNELFFEWINKEQKEKMEYRINMEEWSYNNFIDPYSNAKKPYRMEMIVNNRLFCQMLENEKQLIKKANIKRVFTYFNSFKNFNLQFLGNPEIKNHIQELIATTKVDFELSDNLSKLKKAFDHLCKNISIQSISDHNQLSILEIERKTLTFFETTIEEFNQCVLSTGYTYEIVEKSKMIEFQFNKSPDSLRLLEIFYITLPQNNYNTLLNFGVWKKPND